ncbi:MAG: hypothetical protein RSB71_02140 [Bacilli bacterium]
MVRFECKLNVDDLIIEYMMFKIENGYIPGFLTSEFMEFLSFFESKMSVIDVIYDKKKLFDRFFERKKENSIFKMLSIPNELKKKEIFTKKTSIDDDFITINNHFGAFDSSIINTYFMEKDEVNKIRKVISEFLINQEKRTIDMSFVPNQDKLKTSKYVTAKIVDKIWNGYVKEEIDNRRWPKQCTDIEKYLLQMDLSKIIGLKPLKKELFQFYSVILKRIAFLYQEDDNLVISGYAGTYLPFANYKLLINSYEKLFELAYNRYHGLLIFDFNKLLDVPKPEISIFDDFDKYTEVENIVKEDKKIKRLIKKMDESIIN